LPQGWLKEKGGKDENDLSTEREYQVGKGGGLTGTKGGTHRGKPKDQKPKGQKKFAGGPMNQLRGKKVRKGGGINTQTGRKK